jgi:ubiquitin C-terminal hydrolase
MQVPILKLRNPISQGWYSFDDNIIHKIYDSDIVSEDAYILFYRRKS